MEKQLWIVQFIMLAFAVIYFLFEIFLNVNDVQDDTSNIILFRWTRKLRLIFIPFALGAVGGHLFLGTENGAFKLCNGMMPVILLAGICLVLLFIGRFLLRKDRDTAKWLMTLLLILGFVYGHFIWSMNYKNGPCEPVPPSDCNNFKYSCKEICHD